MNDYHITRSDGTQEGPFSEEELKKLYQDRKLPPNSLVWTPGWATWKACEDAFSWCAAPPFSPTNSNASSVAHCTKQWSGKENLSLPSGCMVTYGNRSRFNGDLRDLHQLMAQSEILGSFDVNRCSFYIQKLWIVPEAFQSERRRNTGCTRSVRPCSWAT